MIDLELDEQFLQSYTLKFAIRADDPKVDDLVEDFMLEYEGERFYITKVIKSRDESKGLHHIEAEAAWMRLADISRPGSFLLDSMSPKRGVTLILSNTGWDVSDMPNTDDEYSMEATDATVLDLLWQWAKITGHELSFDTFNKTVQMVPQVGANRGLTFRYGRNLQSIKRTAQAPKVTRLYAYGRDGLTIKARTGGYEYIEDYSFYTNQGYTLEEAQANYRKDSIWVDDSFLEDVGLYSAAVARLAVLSQPTLLYEASVVDLSEVVGVNEYDYRCGDTVYVYDEVLNIGVNARVSRRVRHPKEPHKDKVELAFSPILIPDPNVNGSRTNTTRNWELFQSRNLTSEKRVRNFSTVIHRLKLKTIADAEWIVSFKLHGVAVGSSHFTITAEEDNAESQLWTPYELDLVDGQEVNYNFTFGQQEIPAGEYILTIRGFSDTADAGVNIPQFDTAFWVLARGTTRTTSTLPNSIRFDYTGSPQEWEVPDDVSELLIECAGAAGGSHEIFLVSGAHRGGAGIIFRATYPVLAGSIYEVYVGGQPGTPLAGGWPGGGRASGGSVSENQGMGGGGCTYMVLKNDSPINALFVAGGGGGSGGGQFASNTVDSPGGDAGFYGGQDAPPLGGNWINAKGATQSAGGDGGRWPLGDPNDIPYNDNVDSNGQAGSFMQGGNSPGVKGFSGGKGGGGGGAGWYGGGGAAGDGGHLENAPGGGGGGSSWIDANATDLELITPANEPDSENSGQGYVIISWESPEEP